MAERKDKLKNKAQVAKSLIKDPTQSQRQVAKDTWLWLGTINRQTQEMEQNGTESDIMDRILGMDDEIMEMVNGITYKKIKKKIENDEELQLTDLKILWDLANNSTKRKAIFWDRQDKGDSNKTITIQV